MLDAKLFGIREICDVVLRAKAPQKIGSRIFYTNEPVLYFDTLKTSTFEGAATTVYAQGGRGNARLVAWDGERTVTFTMEDALISPAGLSILTGAGLISSKDEDIIVHTTEQLQGATVEDNTVTIKLAGKPYIPSGSSEDYIYVMILDSRGSIDNEPFIATIDETDTTGHTIKIGREDNSYTYDSAFNTYFNNPNTVYLVDFYEKKTSTDKALQMNITPDKFGGTFYLEASTLWRDEATGQDLPAEFIIPKCKIQSNFTFNMSSSGDPSTFTFTMDAFPDYTRFDRTEKVLASIQVLGAADDESEYIREKTVTGRVANSKGEIVEDDTDVKYVRIDEKYVTLSEDNTTDGVNVTYRAKGAVTNPTVAGLVCTATNGVLNIKCATTSGAEAGTYLTVDLALSSDNTIKDTITVLVTE